MGTYPKTCAGYVIRGHGLTFWCELFAKNTNFAFPAKIVKIAQSSRGCISPMRCPFVVFLGSNQSWTSMLLRKYNGIRLTRPGIPESSAVSHDHHTHRPPLTSLPATFECLDRKHFPMEDFCEIFRIKSSGTILQNDAFLFFLLKSGMLQHTAFFC